MRYDEFSVFITFTKDARNDCTPLVIDLVTLSIIPGVSRICWKPCSILFRGISACSIDVTYTIDFKCPHKWKSNGFKSGERAGHATGPPRPIHLFAKCRFKNCLATRLKRDVYAPSRINRVQSLTSSGTFSNISCKRVLEKSTYFVPVSFPSRKKGPIKNLPIIPAHTFKLNLHWCLERTITCEFSSSQLWLLLWKLNVLSLVKLAY